MIELLVSLLILCLIAGLAWYIIGLLPLPAPFKQVAQIVFLVICLIVLLGMLFGGVNLPTLRITR